MTTGPLPPGVNPIPLVLLVGLAVLVIPVFLAATLFGTGDSLVRSRLGVSGPRFWLAVLVGLATPLAMAAVGTVPTDLAPARLPTLGLVAGLGLGVVAANRAGRAVRLVRAEAAATGTATDGTVAVTGTVVADDPPTSPFFERPAVAWRWRVEVRNRDEVETARRHNWEPVETGEDGRAFAVDDGSGPLRVDPADARLDLADERTAERAPDEPSPGRASDVADLSSAGERYRFVESVLAPGAEVTALGTARDGPDGSTLGEGALVVAGDLSSVVRGYARTALLAGVVALGLSAGSLHLLAGVFAVSLP